VSTLPVSFAPDCAPGEAAVAYARLRLLVLPLHSPILRHNGTAECSCWKRETCPHVGKHPRWRKGMIEHGALDASASEATVGVWWDEWPRANVGIATGEQSHLLLLDGDPRHGSVESLQRLERNHGRLPETWEVRTGGGGWHRYFRLPVGAPAIGCAGLGDAYPGLDVKGNGGYATAPPSLHLSGKRYAWAAAAGVMTPASEPVDAPAFLLDLLARSAAPVARPATLQTEELSADDGGRDWLDWALTRTGDGVGDLIGFELAQQLLIARVADVHAPLLDYAQRATVNPRNPFTERDVTRWIKSAEKSSLVRQGTPAKAPARRASVYMTAPGANGHRPDPPPDTPTGDEDTQQDAPSPEVSTCAFPLHVLPMRMRTFIATVADAVGCPVDLVAVPALVAAGSAIGNAVELEVKPGWHERACLWALSIARSGDGKSPAHREAMRPLLLRQDTLFAIYRTALAEWHAAREEGEKLGPKPVAEHVAITDSTLEALALALAGSPRGLVMPLDEAASWVLSFNQYRAGGKGADRPHWLKIWAGEQTTIVRATRDPVHLPAPFVAVSGNMPPDKLSALADVDGAEDGFIARILFSYPVPLPARASEQGISPDVRYDWAQVIGKLLRLTPTALGNGQKGVPMLPATAELTPEGRRVWQAWEQQLADEMNGETFPDALRACWSKFKGYTARLALIVNALAWACDEPAVGAFSVHTGSVEGAVELAEYFKAHARRVYAFLHANEATREALGVLEWLRRHKKLTTTAREVQQARLRGISDVTSATLALQRLASMGYGTCETKAERGGKRVVFTRK